MRRLRFRVKMLGNREGMMRCRALWLIGCLGIAAADAQEQATGMVSGNDLLAFCRNPPGGSVCTGYVMGVADALGVNRALMPPEGVAGWRACVPLQVTPGQVRDIVVADLERNPVTRHFGAAALTAKALADAFPCR